MTYFTIFAHGNNSLFMLMGSLQVSGLKLDVSSNHKSLPHPLHYMNGTLLVLDLKLCIADFFNMNVLLLLSDRLT